LAELARIGCAQVCAVVGQNGLRPEEKTSFAYRAAGCERVLSDIVKRRSMPIAGPSGQAGG